MSQLKTASFEPFNAFAVLFPKYRHPDRSKFQDKHQRGFLQAAKSIEPTLRGPITRNDPAYKGSLENVGNQRRIRVTHKELGEDDFKRHFRVTRAHDAINEKYAASRKFELKEQKD